MLYLHKQGKQEIRMYSHYDGPSIEINITTFWMVKLLYKHAGKDVAINQAKEFEEKNKKAGT